MSRPSEMDLRDYGRILLRRKWWVISAVSAGIALALVLNTVTVPVYRATARIQISREPTRSLLTGAELETQTSQSDNLALFTAAELITNRKLMARAVTTLREQGVMSGDETPGQPWYQAMLHGRAVASTPRDAGDTGMAGVSGAQVNWLLRRITVEPVRDTRLVNIHVEGPDPRTSERIANTVADLFVQYQVEQRSAGSSNLVTYLTQQLNEMSESLKKAEDASAYVKARADRLAAEARLAQLQGASRGSNDPDQLPVTNSNLDALRKQLAASDAELAKARQIYKDRHPRLVLLESENESLRASIREEFAGSIAAARSQVYATQARESSLRPAAGEGRDVGTLEADVANRRELYNALLTKLKEAEISGQAHGPLVEVIEPAAADRSPIRPRKLLNFVVCLFAGLTVGTGLAFLREYLRRTIRTPQDVDEYLQLPVLGLIPKA